MSAKERLSGVDRLLDVKPNYASYIHPSNHGVSCGASQKIDVECHMCGCVWKASPNNLSRHCGDLPACFRCVQVTKNKSVSLSKMKPDCVRYLLDPNDAHASSNTTVRFSCAGCGEEKSANVGNMVRSLRPLPYCASCSRKLFFRERSKLVDKRPVVGEDADRRRMMSDMKSFFTDVFPCAMHPRIGKATINEMFADGYAVETSVYKHLLEGAGIKNEATGARELGLKYTRRAGQDYIVGVKPTPKELPPPPCPNIEVAWEFISPEKAGEFYKNQRPNRRISDVAVAKLVSDILAGDWIATHQGIAFDRDGRVCDGQHRLRAVMETGAGQWFLVARGLSDEACSVIDTGRVRSLGDTVSIEDGITDGKARVSVVRILLCAGAGGRSGSKDGPSNQAIHRAVRECAAELDWVFSLRWQGVRCAPVRAALIYARRKYPKEVEAFAEAVCSGDGLAAKSPAHVLREALVTRSSKGKWIGQQHNAVWFRLVLCAARAHIREAEMTRLPSPEHSQVGVDFFIKP